MWRKRRHTQASHYAAAKTVLRDPVEDKDTRTRRLLSNSYFSFGSRAAGATRTFRDPVDNSVDLFSAKAGHVAAPARSAGSGRDDASGKHRMTQRYEEAASRSRAEGNVGATSFSDCSAHYKDCPRESVQDWVTSKSIIEPVRCWRSSSEVLDERTDDLDERTSDNEQNHRHHFINDNEVKEQPHRVAHCTGARRDVCSPVSPFAAVSQSSGKRRSITDGQSRGIEERATDATATDADAVDVKDIFGGTVDNRVSRHVTFLSRTMGLTVDIDYSTRSQPHEGGCLDSQEHLPNSHYDELSPCSGVILPTSPRYQTLQAFRKEMSSSGIDAQMFHTGWKGSFLPPRYIRLFMTESKKRPLLYWRYKKRPRGVGGDGDLGAEDRRVIPLSSLANMGPAELYRQHTTGTRRNATHGRSSWIPIPPWLSRGDENETVAKEDTYDGIKGAERFRRTAEATPVLALSYWVEGEPRWIGDKPNRLLVKLDSLQAFRHLTQGLRLCCVHFHNYACPQDLEDVR